MKHSQPAKGEARPLPPGSGAPEVDALVLGAGVVGMCTAYALARRGLSVALVDAASGPAQGTSFANGAQLSYAYTDALAQPSLLRKIPAMIAGLDPAFRVRLSADPAFLRWGLSFLRNCSDARFSANTLAALQLGLESRAAMADLQARHGFDFAHAAMGKLHIFRDAEALERAKRVAVMKQVAGAEQFILTRQEAIDVEPALIDTQGFDGALWTPSEEVGDPHRFCLGLLEVLRKQYPVRDHFNFSIAKLERRGDRMLVHDNQGRSLAGRSAVVCLGADAPRFLGRLGIRAPIRPMKGYSFTVPPGSNAPSVSLTDTGRKIVFCRLGSSMRIAGLAELDNRDLRVEPARLSALVEGARQSMPLAADYEAIGEGWTGLRPMTPDSRPIIRQAAPGLFLNIGHGMLGWTFAAGSAERVAALVNAARSRTPHFETV
ncbi:FAD-dependent oxidoreductase [Novosphingobium sp. PP1Y]|uniref:FAD-dependent oxidoreductase n=1 Tax=Novosphingobium sp. PP1Y TaxID=702113 RepID=UPI000A0512D1|nr:FAD-dependent oxidoreductase [Novosphingobium sp. PP1Y]